MDESSSVTSTTSSTSVTLTADTSPGGGGSSSSSPMVSVRIYVPELNVQKVIHFHREELVWNVKQQCLATLPKVSFFFFKSFSMLTRHVFFWSVGAVVQLAPNCEWTEMT